MNMTYIPFCCWVNINKGSKQHINVYPSTRSSYIKISRAWKREKYRFHFEGVSKEIFLMMYAFSFFYHLLNFISSWYIFYFGDDIITRLLSNSAFLMCGYYDSWVYQISKLSLQHPSSGLWSLLQSIYLFSSTQYCDLSMPRKKFTKIFLK